MSNGKIFLLDGMALIYRAFFAFIQNPRITSTGLNASAMMGFTNTLLEVIKKQKPITKAKIKRAESADRKDSATIKLYSSLTVKCSEMPAFF